MNIQNFWCFLVSLGFLVVTFAIQRVFGVTSNVESVGWLVLLVGLWSISKIPVSSVVGSFVGLVTMLCVLGYVDSIVFVVWGIFLGAWATFAFFEFCPHEKLPGILQKFSPQNDAYPMFHKIILGIYVLLFVVGIILYVYSYEISTWTQQMHSVFIWFILVHVIGALLLILLSKYPLALFGQMAGIGLALVIFAFLESKFGRMRLFGGSGMEVFSTVFLPVGAALGIGGWIGMQMLWHARKGKQKRFATKEKKS